MGIFKNVIKDATEGFNDQVIAMDMLAGAKGGASAYLTAALEASTPEVKRMYSEYVTQYLMAHQSITELCIKNGWYKPYEQPDTQLAQAYSFSKELIRLEAH
ncbi:MAG: spore coat protein [Mahellales bacterium]|jgi:spore coat protein CotF